MIGETLFGNKCPAEEHAVGKWTRGCFYKTYSAGAKSCCSKMCPDPCKNVCRSWIRGNDVCDNCFAE